MITKEEAMPETRFYLIDTNTREHKTILRRLAKLKSTITMQDNGQYRHCPECSQISIESKLSESELDDWLYNNNLDYIGVVVVSDVPRGTLEE